MMPVYNEGGGIRSTVADLIEAARRAPSLSVDLVVVDDGSTDGSRAAAALAASDLPTQVVVQANSGRHAARWRGIQEADGELVLFLDSRVSLEPNALVFIEGRLALAQDDDVWNAHVYALAGGNPYGRFWNALTVIAFGAYFANPRTTYFDHATFESFPKGTTCFLAPRALLLDAMSSNESLYSDSRSVDDDTPMIRRIAQRRPIGISPEFSCLYRPRESFSAFMRHAFHFGVAFVDGHGRRDAGLYPVVVGLLSRAWP